MSGGKPMIASINDYRSKASLPPLLWDEQLASNAAKTGQATGGRTMEHQLNPGTNGQVLVYGVDDADICSRGNTGGLTPFELFYLSWLCESPGDPGLEGKCPQVLGVSRIDSQGQTGHWQLLSDASFNKIGCAFTRDASKEACADFSGIWACDLGY
jgi:uncharacterized protein YkwD